MYWLIGFPPPPAVHLFIIIACTQMWMSCGVRGPAYKYERRTVFELKSKATVNANSTAQFVKHLQQ